MIRRAAEGDTMIRTYHTIESQDIVTIILTVSRAINITLAKSMTIEVVPNIQLSFVSIEWDMPDYPEAVEDAICDYIYYAVGEAKAHQECERHRNSHISDMWKEWHRKALEDKTVALEDLRKVCLGN